MITDCAAILALLLMNATATGSSSVGTAATPPSITTQAVVAHLAAGYADPVKDISELFDGGYAVSGGATFRFSPSSRTGLRLDLGYERFGATQQVVHSDESPKNAHVDEGYLSMTRLVVDVIYDFGGKKRFGGYFAVGVGGYSRYQTLTRTSLGELFCDAFGDCIFAGEGTVFHDSDRTTKLGNEASLALTIALSPDKQLYIEASYRRVHTESPIQYVPILVGLRF